MKNRRPFLYVIPGEKGIEGPATRLGLKDRFQGPSTIQWAAVIVTKVALLLTVLMVIKKFHY